METFNKIYEDIYKQKLIRHTIASLIPTIFWQFVLVSVVFAFFVSLTAVHDHMAWGIILSLLFYLPLCVFLGIKNHSKIIKEKEKLTVNQFLIRHGIVNDKQVSTLIRICDEKIESKKYIISFFSKIIFFVWNGVFILAISGFILPFIINHSPKGLLDYHNLLQLKYISISFFFLTILVSGLVLFGGKIAYDFYFKRLKEMKSLLYDEKIMLEK